MVRRILSTDDLKTVYTYQVWCGSFRSGVIRFGPFRFGPMRSTAVRRGSVKSVPIPSGPFGPVSFLNTCKWVRNGPHTETPTISKFPLSPLLEVTQQ